MDDSVSIETGNRGGTTDGDGLHRGGGGTDLVAPAPPPDPGPLGRLVGVFIRPRATFESMRERPRFLMPLILLLVVQTSIAVLLYQTGIVAEETVAKMEAQGRSAEQIEAVQGFFEGTGGLVVTLSGAMVFTALSVVSLAGVMFFMGNLMFGARLRYGHYLSAMVFGGVVLIVDQLVRVGLILANRSYDVRLGLGMLFGESTSFGVRALDTITDPLFLWGQAVCALGVAVYARRGFGFGVLVVLPVVLVAVLLSGNR